MDLSDATMAYQRYLSGTGISLRIDYEKAYKESKTLQVEFEKQLLLMKKAVSEFYANGAGSNFEIIGDMIEINHSLESENWDKTIGQHNAFGYGKVNINPTTGNAVMTVTFTMEDMYNFNKGNVDIATGTPDEVNGRFQVLGWAEQFITYGLFTQTVEWTIK